MCEQCNEPVPDIKPLSEYDWMTFISILSAVALFAILVYGQMKQQEQVAICHERNQAQVSELC